MRIMWVLQVVMAVLLCTLIASVQGEAASSIYICEAGDENVLGEYRIESETKDGTSVYSNANDLSIFRNNGFWYIGNLGYVARTASGHSP